MGTITDKLISDLSIPLISTVDVKILTDLAYYEGRGDIVNIVKYVKIFKKQFVLTEDDWSIKTDDILSISRLDKIKKIVK